MANKYGRPQSKAGICQEKRLEDPSEKDIITDDLQLAK